jgi:hypothetical protein
MTGDDAARRARSASPGVVRRQRLVDKIPTPPRHTHAGASERLADSSFIDPIGRRLKTRIEIWSVRKNCAIQHGSRLKIARKKWRKVG